MMLKILVLCFLVKSYLAIRSDAKYIRQEGRPLNIAHRGLSSILPENTLQSLQTALYQGADFIHVNVVLTKQKSLLAMHDPYLSRLTDIQLIPEFSTRYSRRNYNHTNMTDWWTDNFTLNELKKLKIHQNQFDGRLKIFDNQFSFASLSEVIEMTLQFNKQHAGKRNPDGRVAGILIQAMQSQMYRDLYGLEIGQIVLQILKTNNLSTIAQATSKCPIYLQSFDLKTIMYWSDHSDLPRSYLITNTMPYHLQEVNKYANSVGYQDKVAWDYFLSQPTFVIEETRKYELLLHVWTFKDDAKIFQAITNIQMYEIGQNVMKLDGIITDFCDIYAPISQLLKNRKQKKEVGFKNS